LVLGGSSRGPEVGLQTPSAFPKAGKAFHADRTRKKRNSVALAGRQGNYRAVAIMPDISFPKKNPGSHYQKVTPKTRIRGITFWVSIPFRCLRLYFGSTGSQLPRFFLEIAARTLLAGSMSGKQEVSACA
jgi:hypothetical protein